MGAIGPVNQQPFLDPVEAEPTQAEAPAVETAPANAPPPAASAPTPHASAAPAGYERLDSARQGDYIRMGSAGDRVAILQRVLAAAGERVPSSGRFDAGTLSAVRDFQRTHGCKVDGIVGPETLGAMDRALGVAGGHAPAGHGGSPPAHPAHTPPGGGPPGVGHAPAAPIAPGRPEIHAPAPADTAAPAATLSAVPPRPPGAPTGSEFIARTQGLSRPQREEAIYDEIVSGNIPDFERQLRDVTTSFTGPDGRVHTGTYHVLPDYIAIGSNEDSVRIPMSPKTAQRLADHFGLSLPTKKMADQVYAAATVKLTPQPLPAGPRMMSNDYYLRAERKIERQMDPARRGELVAGDKKDVVISNRLDTHPGRVAIYGWHQPGGHPIQPLSTVHEDSYADYSHGIRFAAGMMNVDGREMPIADVMRDPVLSRLLSDEGPIANPRYRY